MRIPRVHVPTPVRPGDRIDLAPGDSHHLARVLRRGPGDPVLLLAAGGAFAGEVLEVRGAGKQCRVAVAVGAPAATVPPPTVPWALALGLAKGEAFDLGLRMAAELGLEAIVPLITRRSFARGLGPTRAERWERIAREAAKQCGRTEPLRLAAAMTLDVLLAEWTRSG